MKLIILSLFLITMPLITHGSKSYLIKAIYVKKNALIVVPNDEFKKKYLFSNFKATYDSSINLERLSQTICSIPFIMSIISIVWQSGKVYYIKKMDKNLYKSLEKIKEVYKTFYPEVHWNGELIPDEIVDIPIIPHENLIGLVFSGGVDSTYSSFAHHEKKQLLITYLGFTEEIIQKKWNEVLTQCFNFARLYKNRKNHFVKSNFRFFIKFGKLHREYPSMDSWREFCQESLSLAGLAAPILFLNSCPEFVISSSWDWGFPYAWGSHPFIDDNISFAGISAKNCDYDTSRQVKLKFIAQFCGDHYLKKPTYHVCRGGFSSGNCTKCEKCLRTINGLLVEQEELPDYGFFISKQDAFDRTRTEFENKTNLPRFTRAVSHIWQDIQKRAKQRLQQHEIYDKHLIEYLDWLCSIDFNSHINLNQFKRKFNFQELRENFLT